MVLDTGVFGETEVDRGLEVDEVFRKLPRGAKTASSVATPNSPQRGGSRLNDNRGPATYIWFSTKPSNGPVDEVLCTPYRPRHDGQTRPRPLFHLPTTTTISGSLCRGFP